MNRDEFLNTFIDISTEKGVDTKNLRNFLQGKFLNVEEKIVCAHEISDSLYIAHKALTDHPKEGVIAEFGCFNGGMSAKLSILAAKLGKKLVIFDSFQGLPCDAKYKTYNPNLEILGDFHRTQFAQSLDTVRKNIEDNGDISVCEFIPGWIEDTLPTTNYVYSTVFIDVDIIETAQFIIKNIWNKIESDGLFTHESCIKDYMDRLLCPIWWKENFNCQPPQIARKCDENSSGFLLAPCLNYLYKSDSGYKTNSTPDSLNNPFEI